MKDAQHGFAVASVDNGYNTWKQVADLGNLLCVRKLRGKTMEMILIKH